MYDFVRPIPGMNGLRALAALGVFFVHFNQMAVLDYTLGPFDLALFMANGNHGVSLFFSLSGFLLSLPFWRSFFTDRPYPSLWSYYLRRVARVIPAYYFLLTLLILWGNLWKMPGTRFDMMAHYLMVFNFTEFTIFSINPPFWSIAVELQFYLVLPFIISGLKICNGKCRLPWTISFLILTFCGTQWMLIEQVDKVVAWPFNPWLTWIRPYGAVLNHSLVATMPHFLLGVAAGALFFSQGRYYSILTCRSEYLFWCSTAFTVLFLSTGWADAIELSFVPYGFPVLPLLIVMMIITVPHTRIAINILDHPILKKMGSISYGIYLYHYPVLVFVEWRMRQKGYDVAEDWIFFGCVGFAATVMVAALSNYLIEQPCLRLVRRK